MSKPRNRKMAPARRTKPTTGQLPPREPGAHGETLNQSRPVSRRRPDFSAESYIDNVLRRMTPPDGHGAPAEAVVKPVSPFALRRPGQR